VGPGLFKSELSRSYPRQPSLDNLDVPTIVHGTFKYISNRSRIIQRCHHNVRKTYLTIPCRLIMKVTRPTLVKPHNPFPIPYNSKISLGTSLKTGYLHYQVNHPSVVDPKESSSLSISLSPQMTFASLLDLGLYQ